MIKIIHGTEWYLLNKYISKIITKFETNDITKLDGDEIDFIKIKKYIVSSSIFDELNKRVILYNNAYFLSNPKNLNKKEKESIIKIFNTLKNDPDILLVISVLSKDISKNPFIKDLTKDIQIIKQKEITTKEYDVIVRQHSIKNNYSIDSEAIKLLIKKTDNNMDILLKELTKLKNFEFVSKHIVEEIVPNYNNPDIFKLIDLLIKNDKEEATEYINNWKIENNVNDNKILSLLISQIKYYSIVKYYLENYSRDINDLNTKIKGNYYRLRIAKEKIENNEEFNPYKILDSLFHALVKIRQNSAPINWIEYVFSIYN